MEEDGSCTKQTAAQQQPQTHMQMPAYGFVQQPAGQPMGPQMVYVVGPPAQPAQNMMWIAPLMLFVVGFFFLFTFAPFAWLLWLMGAVFLFYPDSLTRALGAVNFGVCCFCFVALCSLVCIFTALCAFVTVFPPLVVAAAGGVQPQ